MRRPRARNWGREIGARVFLAGISSTFGGDWVVDVVQGLAPWTMAAKHPAPFLMLTGALGWYVGRAVALWLYKRQDKDAGELVKEARRDFGALASPPEAAPLEEQQAGHP
jgi:hypothetical protein